MARLRQRGRLEVVHLCLVTLTATQVVEGHRWFGCRVPVGPGPAASWEAAQGLACAKAEGRWGQSVGGMRQNMTGKE